VIVIFLFELSGYPSITHAVDLANMQFQSHRDRLRTIEDQNEMVKELRFARWAIQNQFKDLTPSRQCIQTWAIRNDIWDSCFVDSN
jgi:hypothetical protein